MRSGVSRETLIYYEEVLHHHLLIHFRRVEASCTPDDVVNLVPRQSAAVHDFDDVTPKLANLTLA